MSTTSVVSSPFPRKKKTMKLFYHLLSDMRHQRVAVIALAVGQAVNTFEKENSEQRKINYWFFHDYTWQAFAHSALFLVCLGLIHAKQISRLLLLDRLDQKEREEYYETPKIHGISANDIRFLEADRLVNYTLIVLYCATAVAATYALCTLGLLIGNWNNANNWIDTFVVWWTIHSPLFIRCRSYQKTVWTHFALDNLSVHCLCFICNDSVRCLRVSEPIYRSLHGHRLFVPM